MTSKDREVVGRFLAPKSVAIVGASEDASSVSRRLLQVIQQHTYGGEIFLVNPRHDEVAGMCCYPSVVDLPSVVDVALVTVRAPLVPSVLRECAKHQIPAAYIFSAGFNEMPEGPARAEAVRELENALSARQPRVTGPNALGIYNVVDDIAMGFSPTMAYDQFLHAKPRPGNVAVIAQSGGVGFGIFHQGMARGIDFSYVVSTGNELDLGVLEYLDYFIEDSRTDVVVAFLEGLDRPMELRDLGQRAWRAGKRIVVAKMGRSAEARRAAVSHSGHMAGPSHLWSALLRDAGIVEVSDMAELLDVVAALSRWPSGTGNRVGIATASGGAGIWLTDALRSAAVEVPELEPEVQSALTELLPHYASVNNPVDLTAGSRAEMFGPVMSIMGASSGVDVIVAVTSLANAKIATERSGMFADVSQKIGKPILNCSLPAAAPGAVDAFARVGIPVYLSPAGVARAVTALASPGPRVDDDLVGGGPVPPLVDFGAVDGVVHEAAAKAWLAECGFPVPRRHLTRSVDEAVAASGQLGYPVALKVQSSALAHKGDAGVLALDVRSPDEVRVAWSRIHDQAITLVGIDAIAGVLVEEMVRPGFEMLVGITADPALGVFLTVGAGGSYTELFGDVAILTAPASPTQIHDAINGLRCARILDPTHPQPRDTHAFCELAAQISTIAASTPQLQELDLNPVMVYLRGHGTIIVDALAVLKR